MGNASLPAMDLNLMFLVCIATVIGCALSEGQMQIPSIKSCDNFRKKIFWVSDDWSAIVLGKSEDSVQRCQLTFGVSSSPKHETARLKVEIEFMYIHDCGIEVQINESSNSLFSQPQSNHLMMKCNCNQKMKKVLYAQPKNYVRIWWHKKDKFLEAFNFRVNVSMIDGLPVKGPAFSTLVITGLVMLSIICVFGTLFFKYLSHVSQSWHERSVENAIDRALCVYNSQEPLPEEPDHVCLQPGHRGDGRQQARFRSREPEIAFVHRDGRVERFRPFGTTSSSEQLGPPPARGEAENGRPACTRVQEPQRARSQLAASPREGACGMSVPPTTSHHKTSGKKRQRQDDTSSLAGNELPPTYEEAMGMPVALSGASVSDDAAASSNVDISSQELSGEIDSPVEGREGHLTHQQAASTLNTVDYMNVTIGDRSRAHGRGVEQEEVTLTESRSDAPLLPRDEVSLRQDSSLSNNNTTE